MKLLKQDNKIVLYDDIHDKYITIEPDDLNYIFDDNNKLRDNETILNYFKFKHNDFKENKKGYTSKKIDISKQQDETLKNINKDYLTQSFLSKVNGLSELDRIAFIKNPSINTIKRFSTDTQTINKLIKIFEDIKKTTVEIRNNGDDIDDMINYIITNDVKVSIPKAIKTTLETHINNFLTGKITKDDLFEVVKQYRDKFKNNDEYNKFIKIITDLKQQPKDKEDKPVEQPKEIKEILNDNFKEEQTKIINKDDFNDDGFDEAVKLNRLNQLTPENIFKTSNIRRVNKNEIANNSKIYRVLSYLTTNDLINQDNIKMNVVGNIHKYVITIPKKGTLIFSLHKDGYLSDKLDDYLNDISDSNINDIFKNQTYNDIYNHTFNENVEPLKFEYKQIDKPFSKEYDEEKEQLKDIIDSLSTNINKQQFDDIVYKYYATFDIDEQEPFKPQTLNVDSQYYKTNKDYSDMFKKPPNSLLSTYGKEFFNVIPYNFWVKNLPNELIKKYDTAYNFKSTVFNYIDEYINKELRPQKEEIKKQNEEDKKKLDEDIKKLNKMIKQHDDNIEHKKEGLKENEETLKKFKDELKKTKSKDKIDSINKKIYNIEFNTQQLNEQIDKENEEKQKIEEEKQKKEKEKEINNRKENEDDTDNINENIIDYLFERFKDDLGEESTEEQEQQINKTKTTFTDLFNEYFNKKPSYFTKQYNVNDNYIMPKTADERMRRTKAFEKAREQQIRKEFEGLGGKTWSYTVLKKIDELNELTNNLNTFAKNSNGRLYLGGKTWSYTTLKKIDELNELVNKFN